MRIGVVIPTVKGREEGLAEVRHAYRRTSPEDTVYSVQRGWPTCGEAWSAGAKYLYTHPSGLGLPAVDALHFTADDLVPCEGWWLAATELLKMGIAPGCVLLNEDGTTWNTTEPPGSAVSFPRVPFLRREWWEAMLPIPPLHYYSDCWIGDRLTELGIEIKVCDSYRFIHRWAEPGRIHDSNPDRELYERSTNEVATGAADFGMRAGEC